MSGRLRAAVLISGRGSNMMALAEAARSPGCPFDVGAVIANRPDAAGLSWAAKQGLSTLCIDHREFAGRQAFEDRLHEGIVGSGCEFIALAGFMRLLTPAFVDRWYGRMINIHPSLLPAYKGLHTHARALADGVRIAGCTVHFVVPEMDAGPIIAQGAVPVIDGDTPDTLAARILALEHHLYPRALALVASGAARLADGIVTVADGGAPSRHLVVP